MSACIQSSTLDRTLKQTWGTFIGSYESLDTVEEKQLVHDILLVRRFMLYLGDKTNIGNVHINVLFHVSGLCDQDDVTDMFPPCTKWDAYTIEKV